jgi:hypothetical protein
VKGDKVTGDNVTRGQSDRGQSERGQSVMTPVNYIVKEGLFSEILSGHARASVSHVNDWLKAKNDDCFICLSHSHSLSRQNALQNI